MTKEPLFLKRTNKERVYIINVVHSFYRHVNTILLLYHLNNLNAQYSTIVYE